MAEISARLSNAEPNTRVVVTPFAAKSGITVEGTSKNPNPMKASAAAFTRRAVSNMMPVEGGRDHASP